MKNPLNNLLRWIREKLQLQNPPTEDSELTLVEEIVRELTIDKNSGIVRKIHKAAGEELLRLCKKPIWDRLIELAKKDLLRADPTKVDPTCKEIGEALGGVHWTNVSKASDGKAPITLERILATLVYMRRHWGALGDLPAFDELSDGCLCCAIGCAQRIINENYGLPRTTLDQPTREELSLLRAGYLDQSASAESKKAWDTWSEGWLITKLKLGFNEG